MEFAVSTISWALTDDPVVRPYFADRCNELGSLFTTRPANPTGTSPVPRPGTG